MAEDSTALNQYFPTSTLVTGQDILFFWVARMIMMQLAVRNEIPFDTVYLHGLVRDAKGKKMSKSTGNVVDQLTLLMSMEPTLFVLQMRQWLQLVVF